MPTSPDGMYPQVLRELADAIPRLLMIIFERLSWLVEVHEDCKKANFTPVFRKARKRTQDSQPDISPWEAMEYLIQEAILSIHKDDK